MVRSTLRVTLHRRKPTALGPHEQTPSGPFLNSETMQLHVITDFHLQQRFSHAELTAMALRGGATHVQFRQKTGAIRERYRACHKARDVARRLGGLFIVNDRVDLALAVDADGVHVGQEDLPARVVRALIGPRRILGVTATTTEAAQCAERDGADYIGFGPVFPTASKANPASVKGLEGLMDAAHAVQIPVIAIAGVTAARIPALLAHGAAGCAVLSEICLAPDPEAATRACAARFDLKQP